MDDGPALRDAEEGPRRGETGVAMTVAAGGGRKMTEHPDRTSMHIAP